VRGSTNKSGRRNARSVFRAAVEAFLKKTGAQLWIEHDLANFNKQKKAPGYYE